MPFSDASGKNTIAIIGDSHGGHLYPGLITQTKGDEAIALFPSACAVPLIGLTGHSVSEGFDYILSHSNIQKVVLAHRPGCSWYRVTDTRHPNNHDFNAILHDGFVRTFDALTKAGKKIYVLLDNPYYNDLTFLKCKAEIVRRPVFIPLFLSSSQVEICSEKESDLREREIVDNWSKVAHEAAAGYNNVKFIDFESFFCHNGTCSMLDSKGNLLYRDPQHLNRKGSLLAAPFIIEHLRD